MANRRRKHRTHVPVDPYDPNIPRCLAFRLGRSSTGRSITELVSDLRAIFSPNTARKLREKRSNVLKDFVAVAGTLGITHLAAVVQASGDDCSCQLRMMRLPAGPGLHFRLRSFVSQHDLRQATGNARQANGPEYSRAPLVIFSGFDQPEEESSQANETSNKDSSVSPFRVEPQWMLVKTFLQAAFPDTQSSLPTTKDTPQRLLLFHLTRPSDGSEPMLIVRHYLIQMKPSGLSDGMQRLLQQMRNPSHTQLDDSENVMHDLANLEDISEVLLHGNAESQDSNAMDVNNEFTEQLESTENINELAENVNNSSIGYRVSGKKKVQLVELGPRMSLSLSKIHQDGISKGALLFEQTVGAELSKSSKTSKPSKPKTKEQKRQKAKAVARATKQRK